MNGENFVIPTRENIEAILKFLPYFSNPDNKFYEIVGGEKVDGVITMPFYNYIGETSRFHHSLYNEKFVQGFDWVEWQDKAIKIYENPELLTDADILTIVKYFTLIVRKERFYEGFIASMIDDGFILKLLLRLKEIYESKQF